MPYGVIAFLAGAGLLETGYLTAVSCNAHLSRHNT